MAPEVKASLPGWAANRTKVRWRNTHSAMLDQLMRVRAAIRRLQRQSGDFTAELRRLNDEQRRLRLQWMGIQTQAV